MIFLAHVVLVCFLLGFVMLLAGGLAGEDGLTTPGIVLMVVALLAAVVWAASAVDVYWRGIAP